MLLKSMRDIVAHVVSSQRKSCKETLDKFGDRLGMDRQQVWKLEKSKKNMTCNYMDGILKKLNRAVKVSIITENLNNSADTRQQITITIIIN